MCKDKTNKEKEETTYSQGFLHYTFVPRHYLIKRKIKNEMQLSFFYVEWIHFDKKMVSDILECNSIYRIWLEDIFAYKIFTFTAGFTTTF